MEEKPETVAVDESSERKHPPPLPESAAPWLVIPFEEEGNNQNQALYNISEPNNKTIRKSIPELNGGNTFYQKPSHQGWVVIRCDDEDDELNHGVCFLWNPLSLKNIQLPNIEDLLYDIYDDDDFCIYDCVLSSPPKNGCANDNDDSVVYFLVLECVNLIVYCRVGDANWAILEIPKGIVGDRDMTSLICFKGKLYVMCCNDHRQLVVERLPQRCGNCDCISLGIRRLEVSVDRFVFPYRGGYSCVGNTYFLESDEEIYMIEMVCLDKRGYLNYLVVSINMSRLDFSSMSWKEVNTLGDTVLFLGENTNACCSAAELGLSKGYLYYTLPEDKGLYMFDVEDKCTTTILPCSELPTSWFSSQWIMMPQPTISVAVGGELKHNLSSKVRQDDYPIKMKETEEKISEDDNENLKKKQRKECLDEPRPWMVINEDIVNSIACHLHPVDFLHFRAVCKANKLPIVKQISGAIRSTYLTPWLLFSTENATRYNFVDPMHNNEKYLMNLPELLAGAIVRCQKGGWLLMSKVMWRSSCRRITNQFFTRDLFTA
ncbi:uncharacterized protein LOC113345040 isoform X2 [Papaver somniferum]|uniref:uncharacterized protein LOC113345040 isoform X2 n=1 Tax=Papaver somniferum TaxID=3469 RepID=UPI000E701D98|nr:uncharacterized protein LOC113345040 isoform X2 [Papaver somniferum]